MEYIGSLPITYEELSQPRKRQVDDQDDASDDVVIKIIASWYLLLKYPLLSDGCCLSIQRCTKFHLLVVIISLDYTQQHLRHSNIIIVGLRGWSYSQLLAVQGAVLLKLIITFLTQ